MKPGATRKIYKVGEEVLTKVAEAVAPDEFGTEKLTRLIDELNTVAREIGAVGFSAPQLGHSKRLMTIGMEFNNPRRPNVQQFPNMTFVNPELTYVSPDTSEDWEGCASFDNRIALVSRPITIRYTAQDVKGKKLEGELKNFPARVFQHELDHINGKLMDGKAKETRLFDREKETIISMKP